MLKKIFWHKSVDNMEEQKGKASCARGQLESDQYSLNCLQPTNLDAALKTDSDFEEWRKAYQCDHCKRSFSSSSSLKCHVLIHSGEKPHTCDHCDYSSSCASTLKRHLMIHSGEKLNTCNHCGYSCNQAGNLRQHMHVHLKSSSPDSANPIFSFRPFFLETVCGANTVILLLVVFSPNFWSQLSTVSPHWPPSPSPCSMCYIME